VQKVYLALLTGELHETALVDEPLGRDLGSAIVAKQAVVRGAEGRPAVTEFQPLARGGGWTLAKVVPRTGRQHQIRVHAAALGYPIIGDKLYGPDPQLFLEFIAAGFTTHLRERLLLERHALHALAMAFEPGEGGREYRAALAGDLREFARTRMGLAAAELDAADRATANGALISE
jgi:23S rRNA pseudouridine1911/1915/1917 synthase